MRHRGPLVEELPQYNKKFKWPDNRAKLYFPKEVSDKWNRFIEKFLYPEDKVKSLCVKWFEGRGV